jgi:hypothetical protein
VIFVPKEELMGKLSRISVGNPALFETRLHRTTTEFTVDPTGVKLLK